MQQTASPPLHVTQHTRGTDRPGARTSRSNAGVFMAILAALTSFAFIIWPIAGFGAREAGGGWWISMALMFAVTYLAAAFSVDSIPGVAKAMLIMASVMQIALGIYFGVILADTGTFALYASFIDLFPGILALIAGFIIGPLERHAGF